MRIDDFSQPAETDFMSRMDKVIGAFDALEVAMDGAPSLESMLARLVDLVMAVVPGTDAVSVTALTGQGPHSLAATDEQVVSIDLDQYAAGDGPCLEAARSRLPVRVGVGESAERWPGFTSAALAAGMLAYLCAPLLVGDSGEGTEVVGALNLYGRAAGAFDSADELTLRLLCSGASAVITAERRYATARGEAESLRRALTTRAEIDQAKGALMAVHGIGADEAFARLIRHSQRTNIKLHEVARILLASFTG